MERMVNESDPPKEKTEKEEPETGNAEIDKGTE